MTGNQRDKGKVISVLILTLIVLLGFLSSCTSLRTAPSNTIKVLAVTSEGDTIQLDINSLRPRVYQNIYHTYPYYHNYWRPSPYYTGGNMYYQGSISGHTYKPSSSNNTSTSNNSSSSTQVGSGSGPNTSSPILSNPPSNPAATNPKKNN